MVPSARGGLKARALRRRILMKRPAAAPAKPALLALPAPEAAAAAPGGPEPGAVVALEGAPEAPASADGPEDPEDGEEGEKIEGPLWYERSKKPERVYIRGMIGGKRSFILACTATTFGSEKICRSREAYWPSHFA
jgi:hypothetical protein